MTGSRERITSRDESGLGFWKSRRLPVAGCGCLVALLILLVIIIFIPYMLPPGILNDDGVGI